MLSTLIKTQLKRVGMNQRQLADALGTSTQNVNRWLQSEQGPPVERWRAFEDALDLPAGHFARTMGLVPAEGERDLIDFQAIAASVDKMAAKVTAALASLADELSELRAGTDPPKRRGRRSVPR